MHPLFNKKNNNLSIFLLHLNLSDIFLLFGFFFHLLSIYSNIYIIVNPSFISILSHLLSHYPDIFLLSSFNISLNNSDVLNLSFFNSFLDIYQFYNIPYSINIFHNNYFYRNFNIENDIYNLFCSIYPNQDLLLTNLNQENFHLINHKKSDFFIFNIHTNFYKNDDPLFDLFKSFSNLTSNYDQIILPFYFSKIFENVDEIHLEFDFYLLFFLYLNLSSKCKKFLYIHSSIYHTLPFSIYIIHPNLFDWNIILLNDESISHP